MNKIIYYIFIQKLENLNKYNLSIILCLKNF